ncbi:MAG: uroporphyrinogen decarboxylase [Deltaproteobacteria bacterium]|nr:uroporphyrinogen decarboxylase [Deltaproteobacteria bacterium]
MKPKERFINACLNKEVDRPPVWMMRQAGRYLPEYRKIKEQHATKKMMQTPELASEITLQPVSILGVDAAILYSDILMVADAMGMGLDFAVGEGPVFDFYIKDAAALDRLNTQHVTSRLSYVFKAISLCAQRLPQDYPLLGFAGAPFTVACYMISANSRANFSDVKTLAWTKPRVFHGLMDLLTGVTIDYLVSQADAGVAAVQLFDTWAGLLSPRDYQELAKPYSKKIFDALRSSGIPSIHFIRGGQALMSDMTTLASDVIAVDWRVDLKTIYQFTKGAYAVQGNLDPDILLTTPTLIQQRVTEMIASVPNPKKGYIVNLGHGVGQNTPVENVRCFVDAAKNPQPNRKCGFISI